MKNLRHAPLEEIEQLMAELGEPKFRAVQIHDWIWKKHASSIDEMSNLSKKLREQLHEVYQIPKVTIDHSQFSNDGTIKSRLKLHDNRFIEGVLIPTEKRMTACVSSQVGCSLSCKFCATGYLPRARNLDFDEIVDEVTLINEQAEKHFDRHLSNIVFMGMGEPLLNYKKCTQGDRTHYRARWIGYEPPPYHRVHGRCCQDDQAIGRRWREIQAGLVLACSE